jgi:hypothetical protein
MAVRENPLDQLKNVGPADIASQNFDGGKPVVTRHNCTMLGVTRSSHPEVTVSSAAGSEGVLGCIPDCFAGVIVVWRAGPPYSVYGHVGIVIRVTANSSRLRR